MAIEVSGNPAEKTLDVRVSGKLSTEDYQTLEPAVESLVSEVGKINLLFVMQDFHGWEMGAIWEDIRFDAHHWSEISKIAMVGEAAMRGRAWQRRRDTS